MSNFYDQIRDSAAGPLIKKYGLALTLRRIVKGAYDPATDQISPDTVTDYPCYGLVENYKEYTVASSLVRRGDKKLILSAQGLSIEPQIGDQFLGFPDGTWFIPDGEGNERHRAIEPLAPAGIPIIYTIQIRQ